MPTHCDGCDPNVPDGAQLRYCGECRDRYAADEELADLLAPDAAWVLS